MARDEISLRVCPENLEALVEGRDCRITYIRLAKGVDGVYQLYIEGRDESPLPVHSEHPAVPLVAGLAPRQKLGRWHA